MNKSEVYGLISGNPDKAGNVNLHIPVLDKIGHEAIERLQQRSGPFKPIKNADTGREYIHLFQLSAPPWLITYEHTYDFFVDKIKNQVPALKEQHEIGAHSFRHHILTEIYLHTGSIDAVQTAGGHLNKKMPELYTRSKLSKEKLATHIFKKYRSGEVSGKFFIELIGNIENDYSSANEDVIRALNTNITFEEWIQTYGRRLDNDMGFCLSVNCINDLKCWSCPRFLVLKEQLESAIISLARQFMFLETIKNESNNFTWRSPYVTEILNTIGVMIKRIEDIGLTKDEIMQFTLEYRRGGNLKKVLNQWSLTSN